MGRLWLRIFIIAMSANALLLLLLYWGFHWSFDQSFNQYMHNQVKNRIASLSEDVVSLYLYYGNWDWVYDQPDLWRNLLHDYLQSDGDLSVASPDIESMMPRQQERLLPDALSGDLLFLRENTNSAAGNDSYILLYDEMEQLIIGDEQSNLTIYKFPLMHNGEQIGVLGVRVRSKLLTTMNRIMRAHNEQRFFIIFGALVALSSLMAFVLASWAAYRMDRFKKGANALVRGEFEYRLQTNSRDAMATLTAEFNRLAQILQDNRDAHLRWLTSANAEANKLLERLQAEVSKFDDKNIFFSSVDIHDLSVEIGRLKHLFAYLEQLSQAELGSLNYHKNSFNVSEFIQEEISRIRSALPQTMQLIWHEKTVKNTVLLGDKKRLRQMLTHLLDNSIKYTDIPGVLDISVTVDKHEVLFIWQDSAPGVNAVECAKLTEPFYSLKQTYFTKNVSASMGLIIVQAIVRAHGGSMVATPSELGGLCWQFRFPIRQ